MQCNAGVGNAVQCATGVGNAMHVWAMQCSVLQECAMQCSAMQEWAMQCNAVAGGCSCSSVLWIWCNGGSGCSPSPPPPLSMPPGIGTALLPHCWRSMGAINSHINWDPAEHREVAERSGPTRLSVRPSVSPGTPLGFLQHPMEVWGCSPLPTRSSSAHGIASLSRERLIRSPLVTLHSSQPIATHPTVGRGVGAAAPQVPHVPQRGGWGGAHPAPNCPTALSAPLLWDSIPPHNPTAPIAALWGGFVAVPRPFSTS